MAAVTTRTSRFFSTSSVPMNMPDDDFCEELPSQKSFSRVRKLSKRLSATFKSSFSLRETDATERERRESSGALNEKTPKKPLGRVFSLQHFTDSSMFRDVPSKKPSQHEEEEEERQQASPTIQSQSTMDISNFDNRDRLRRVLSVPEGGSPLKRISSSPYGKLEQYTKLEQLGEGSYATVYKGISKKSNIFVALKEIRLQQEEGIPFTAIREASLLKDLKHANIVRLHDIIPSKEHLVLVFEYLHTDLCIYLEERPFGAHPSNAKLLLFQLLRGLQFIHRKKILHRDIKPQNVLLSNRGELKLADFGLARAKSVPSKTYTHEIVTLWYRPPDVLLGSTVYTTSLDIWGVGCIFVEMISGFPLFPGVKSTRDQLNKIFKICGTPNVDDWPMNKSEYTRDDFEEYSKVKLSHQAPRIKMLPYAEELADQMLQFNPRSRVSADDGMRHIYFADLPKGVFTLPDGVSILTIPGVRMVDDHRTTNSGSKLKNKSFGQFV